MSLAHILRNFFRKRTCTLYSLSSAWIHCYITVSGRLTLIYILTSDIIVWGQINIHFTPFSSFAFRFSCVFEFTMGKPKKGAKAKFLIFVCLTKYKKSEFYYLYLTISKNGSRIKFKRKRQNLGHMYRVRLYGPNSFCL